MKIVGGWLIALGVIAAVGALFLSTSVETPTSAYLGEFGRSNTVYNLGLLQRQVLLFQAGLATGLCGVVVLSAGLICDHIRSAVANGTMTPRMDDNTTEVPLVTHVASGAPTQQFTAPFSEESQDRLFWGLIACIVIVGIVATALFWVAPPSN